MRSLRISSFLMPFRVHGEEYVKTIPLWSLFVAMLLPTVAAVAGSVARYRSPAGFNNHSPRQQVVQLEGIGARAYAPQLNAWEALAVFSCIRLQ